VTHTQKKKVGCEILSVFCYLAEVKNQVKILYSCSVEVSV